MFLGHLERAIGNCEQQPVFVFDFDVRTKMFHEEPYKNGATSVRNEYCRADHGDELMYMFGTAFLAEGSFEIAVDRYFSEDEKNLQKRMMKAMGLISVLKATFIFTQNRFQTSIGGHVCTV